jgi:hypothetical protein
VHVDRLADRYIPDTRLEVVVVTVGGSDRGSDRRPDGSVALRRVSNIGSDEHGLVGDSGLKQHRESGLKMHHTATMSTHELGERDRDVDTSELGVDLHGDVRAVLVKTSVRLKLLGLEALGRNRSIKPVCARRAALAIGSEIKHRSDHLLGSGSSLDLFVKSDLSSGHDDHDQLRGLFTSVECSLASLLQGRQLQTRIERSEGCQSDVTSLA